MEFKIIGQYKQIIIQIIRKIYISTKTIFYYHKEFTG